MMALELSKQLTILDNFLSDEQLKKLFTDIASIQDNFKTYRKQDGDDFYLYERIFLNDYFKNNPIQVLTRQFLEQLGYNPEDLDITITSYGTCQRYDWHDDDVGNRTHNYILYLTDPEYFKGGELEVKIDGKVQTITPKKNRLVIMPASLQHRVLPVETTVGGIWQMSRLTLNGHIKKTEM